MSLTPAQHERLADELVDQDGRLNARTPELPEEPLAETVDRPGANLVDVYGIDECLLLRRQRRVVLQRINDAKSPAEDAGPKLLSGLLRKGGRQNAVGRNPVNQDKLQNAESEACSLPRARPCDDEKPRRCGRIYSLLLLCVRTRPKLREGSDEIRNDNHCDSIAVTMKHNRAVLPD